MSIHSGPNGTAQGSSGDCVLEAWGAHPHPPGRMEVIELQSVREKRGLDPQCWWVSWLTHRRAKTSHLCTYCLHCWPQRGAFHLFCGRRK